MDATRTTTTTWSSSTQLQTSSPSYNLLPMENCPKAADDTPRVWSAHRWWSSVGSTWSISATYNTSHCSNVETLWTDKNTPPRKQDTKSSSWRNRCLCTLCKRWTRTSLSMTLSSSCKLASIKSRLLWGRFQTRSNKSHFTSISVSNTHIPQTHNARHLPYLCKISTLVLCPSRCSMPLWLRTCWSCQKIVRLKDCTSC